MATDPILVPYHLDEPLPTLAGELDRSDALYVTVDLPHPAGRWERMAALYAPVAEAVAASVAAGRTPVVVSGDCTTVLGTVTGVQRAGRDPGAVWFDAHGDLHTPESTTSGYLGGLPLRLLVGAAPELVAAPLGLRPLRAERAVLVDGRDLDPPESAYLAGSPLARVTVDRVGIAGLPAGDLVLHVDLDVVDAAEVPGLRFPVSPGPSTASVLDAVRRVLATGRVLAVDVGCTWRPGVEETRRTLLRRLLTVVEDAGAFGG